MCLTRNQVKMRYCCISNLAWPEFGHKQCQHNFWYEVESWKIHFPKVKQIPNFWDRVRGSSPLLEVLQNQKVSGGEMEKVSLLLQRQNITRGLREAGRQACSALFQKLKRFPLPPPPPPQRHLELTFGELEWIKGGIPFSSSSPQLLVYQELHIKSVSKVRALLSVPAVPC